MDSDLNQPEFIIQQDKNHIKPVYGNTPLEVITVQTYDDLKRILEKLLATTGLDILYLCQIISENNLGRISIPIFNTIRKYIEIDIGTDILEFWSHVSKNIDSSHEIFKKRRFPSTTVRDEKWKMIINATHNKKSESNRISRTAESRRSAKPANLAKKYPKQSNIVKLSDEEKKGTNHDKFHILPIDQYSNVYTASEIGIIFQCLMTLSEPGLMLKLWCKLMLQPETIHLVICNKPVWDLISQYFNKKNVREIVVYCMFYGLLVLEREETMASNGITTDYRFVMNINDARNIPTIMTMSANVNPWNNHMVGSEYVSSRTIFHLNGPRKLTSADVLRRRFKIATHGAFEGINLADFDAALVGSILIPVMAHNPLEAFFGEGDLTDDEFTRYLNYYYPSESELEERSVENMLTQDDKVGNGIGQGPTITDMDVAIKAITTEDFIKKSRMLFEQIRQNIPDADFKECATTGSLKFSIVLPQKRWIDLFQCSDLTFLDLVWRFHLSVVKMYWDGNDFWLFKSCLTSLLSGVCGAYGWVSCNKSAADIVLKYAQRGYSTCINKDEETAITQYMKINKRWNIWNVDSDFDKLSRADKYKKIKSIELKPHEYITGSYSPYNHFFHPGQVNNGIGIRYYMKPGSKQNVQRFNNDPICESLDIVPQSGLNLRYRKTTGVNTKPPNMFVINSVTGGLFPLSPAT